MKRIICVCLGLCLVFASTVSFASDIVDDLRVFAESILQLPDGYQSMTAMSVAPDGAIVAAASKPSGEWDLLTWQDPSATPSVTPLQYDGGAITNIDIAPDGYILATVSNVSSLADMMPTDTSQPSNTQGQDQQTQAQSDQEQPILATQTEQSAMGTRQNQGSTTLFGGRNISTTFIWFAQDGTVLQSFEKEGMIQQTKALSGKRVAISEAQSGISIYDEDTVEEKQIGVSNVQSITATDKTLYVITSDAVHIFDIESGEQLINVPLQAGYSVQAYAKQDGSLYLANSEGVFALAPNTSQIVRILEPVGTLLGDPSNSVISFGVLQNDAIVVLTGTGTMSAMNRSGGGAANRVATAFFGGDASETTTLAVYTPIDAASIGSRAEFRITALRNSNKLRKAVTDFQRQHPEIKVVLQVQLEENDDAPIEDHVRTLNTDLLAGKGGDVLILDDLPIEKYAERGILADLSDILPELDILPGIKKGETNLDGKVYALPAQFSFQTLWGRAKDIDPIQNLEDMVYANLAVDQAPLVARSPEELLRLFYPSSEASFRDEQGKLHFNTPEFASFLDALYELYITQGELADLQFQIPGGRGVGRNGINPAEMLAVYNGAVAFYPVEVNGLMQMTSAYSLAGGKDGDFITLPSISGQGFAYTPSVRVGVNAQSTQLPLAMEFLKSMFSNDIQEMDQMNGLPVTASALDKLFADALERSEDGARGMVMIPGGVSLELSQPDEQAWNALKALCLQVDIPATVDETLMGFLLSETVNFFEGRGTSIDAGQAVEQRAWFYLNE